MITYPCWEKSSSKWVKGAPGLHSCKLLSTHGWFACIWHIDKQRNGTGLSTYHEKFSWLQTKIFAPTVRILHLTVISQTCTHLECNILGCAEPPTIVFRLKRKSVNASLSWVHFIASIKIMIWTRNYIYYHILDVITRRCRNFNFKLCMCSHPCLIPMSVQLITASKRGTRSFLRK